MVRFMSALQKSIAYLNSDDAEASIRRDPYWPKWNTPWWHMTLLWELGLAERIPERAVTTMIDALNNHFLDTFPLVEADIPDGADPYRHIACHCALGTMYRVLAACGVAVDVAAPHLRPWFLRYQLPDGGLNCDEEVYTKRAPHSSMVSTLPPLEAILFDSEQPLTDEDIAFVDRGAAYLLNRRLFRSVSKNGAVIDSDWLEPCFPRFYEYDVLRGLRFLAGWAARRGQPLPAEAIAEASDAVEAALARDDAGRRRRPWSSSKTMAVDENGVWAWGEPSSRFDLLEETDGQELLREEWATVKSSLPYQGSSHKPGPMTPAL
jgi:hypothetical protein